MPDDNEITRELMVGSTVWPVKGEAADHLGEAPVKVVDATWNDGTLWLTVKGDDGQNYIFERDDFALNAPTVTPSFLPATTPREEILEEAARTIMGDRRKTYGDAQQSFDRIAALWSPILSQHVSATQVALCMAALKISRAVGAPDHRDSFVDLAGYAALAFELDPPAAPLPEGDPA